jgi:hypothetical protein
MTTGRKSTLEDLTTKISKQLVGESRLSDALFAVDREFRLLGTVHELIPAQSSSKVVMAHALKELELRLAHLEELCCQIYKSK